MMVESTHLESPKEVRKTDHWRNEDSMSRSEIVVESLEASIQVSEKWSEKHVLL